jgi:glycosyltransferase involved in cell wall biosynthesis
MILAYMEHLLYPGAHILLVVAHPDDEIIFCGGVMLKYPQCKWNIVSMTGEGREQSFESSIKSLKAAGVNVVQHIILHQQPITVIAKREKIVAQAKEWEEALRTIDYHPDLVITHNSEGEYGHAAHALLHRVVKKLFPVVWNFGYRASHVSDTQDRFCVEIESDIKELKKRIFVESYPSEQYIWQALAPMMHAQFDMNQEVFVRSKKRLLVLLPDRFTKSNGGIGANSGPVFEQLSSEYEISIVGYPLKGEAVPEFVTHYREVNNMFSEVKSPVLNIMLSQVSYCRAALSCPHPDSVMAFDWSIYQAAVEVAQHFNVPLITRMSMSPVLLSKQGYVFGLNSNERSEQALHNGLCEMEIRGLRHADRIIHVSHAYEAMYKSVVPEFSYKSRQVIDGINLALWQSIPAHQYALPGKNKKKIIFLGRLSEVKGIIPLCKAVVPSDIDLIFVGSLDTADVVCKKAIEEKKTREENVYTIGALYGEEKVKALKSAQALIMPSYHESFGAVALEGLAAGCVVLSSRVGGLADFLNDTNGIYCGMTPEEIERAYAIFTSCNEKQIEMFQEAGKVTCSQLTIESTVEQLKKVLNEVL